MAVRCVLCGATVDGLAQLCNDCSEAKHRHDQESAALAAQATMVDCPSCGVSVSRAAESCPSCGASFIERKGHIAGGSLAYGGFWSRLAAWIIDGTILLALTLAVNLALDSPYLELALNVAIGLTYTVGFWLIEGATPGKMAMNLRVVGSDGAAIGPGEALTRYFGYFLCGLTLGLGYLLIVFSDKKQGLHDHVAGTLVVQDPK